ncbi:UDP-N-acetylglucosamine 2-epimerase (non-hydrolysing) [Paenibacillus sp. yr247]|uniref:non-hydrolyzing UDP-N-acetylglucosamine 2-epimerase n=1 Tax=Paenibacillus sp. yr247 TaxID=1761880 RepID=UPI00088B4DB7|nr:UDP-N-acetylglucosamine 2-epimerase (non-hydrolyzing) [Paenibacillus sp. yr247]SDO21665.1 UDP-N-acetylglucosamine 2-epimerase (non-hydrolysing) [Paenibacillus sp. yr247]
MRIAVIVGTRPEGIKLAPIIHRMNQEPLFKPVVINTGQHLEMLDQVLTTFFIKADYQLKLMRNTQTLEQLTADILTTLTPILKTEAPDLLIVQGDTTTAFAGAYAAFLLKIPVAHIEAGLRTYNCNSPFPEEMNRQLITRLASYHFTATDANKKNLIEERVPSERVWTVGNTVIDALLQVSSTSYEFPQELHKIIESDEQLLLVTTHRRESFEQMWKVYRAISRLVEENKQLRVLLPIHKNPLLRKQASIHLIQHDRIHVVEPLDYECFVHVMKRAYVILTDSGGIQEEAPALNIPVLVIREQTERQEGITAGTLRLVGLNVEDIIEETTKLLYDRREYEIMAQALNPYGDGNASERIINVLKGLNLKQNF